MIDIPKADGSAPRTGIALPPQVAAYLETTTNRLARLRAEGKGPAFTRLGRSIRYLWEDVHSFVESNRQGSADSTAATVDSTPADGEE